MSAVQVQSLREGPAHLWVFQYLAQTGQTRTPEQLSKHLGLPYPVVLAAVKALVETKMLEARGDDGGYACPHFKTNLLPAMMSLGREFCFWYSNQVAKRMQTEDKDHYYQLYFIPVDSDGKIELMTQVLIDTMMKLHAVRSSAKPFTKGTLMTLEARLCPLIKIGE